MFGLFNLARDPTSVQLRRASHVLGGRDQFWRGGGVVYSGHKRPLVEYVQLSAT